MNDSTIDSDVTTRGDELTRDRRSESFPAQVGGKKNSLKPKRKIAYMIFATFVVHGFLSVSEKFIPGITGLIPAEQWVAALVVLLTGYMTRDEK